MLRRILLLLALATPITWQPLPTWAQDSGAASSPNEVFLEIYEIDNNANNLRSENTEIDNILSSYGKIKDPINEVLDRIREFEYSVALQESEIDDILERALASVDNLTDAMPSNGGGTDIDLPLVQLMRNTLELPIGEYLVTRTLGERFRQFSFNVQNEIINIEKHLDVQSDEAWGCKISALDSILGGRQYRVILSLAENRIKERPEEVKGFIEGCRRFFKSNANDIYKTRIELYMKELEKLTDRIDGWERKRLENLSQLENLEQSRKSALLRMESIITRRNELQLALSQERQSEIKNSSMLTIAMTLVAWATIIGLVIFAIIRMSNSDGDGQHSNYPLFLELTTVFVLTAAILVLGLADKIEDEGLAALIGGISGYVLGRLKDLQLGGRAAVDKT